MIARHQLLLSRSVAAGGRHLISSSSKSNGTNSSLPLQVLGSAPLSRSNRSYSFTPTNLQYYGGSDGGNSYTASRAFPQYSIFGDDALLTVKPLLPTFKPATSDGVALDRKGKIMMSFTPRVDSGGTTGGGFRWQDQITIALAVEEVGLLINQLPSYEVEICRGGPRPGTTEGTGNMEYGMNSGAAQEGGGVQISDAPDKVLTARPGDGATVSFKIDFVRDGVGGQISPVDDNSQHAPLEVVVQAGEFEVLKRIMESSIPYLLGWTSMMDIGVASMMRSGFNGGGNR